MFNVGGGEVLVILLVALVVLGPDKLPGAVRSVGNMVGELRKLSNGFQSEMRNAMYDGRPNPGSVVGGPLTPTGDREQPNGDGTDGAPSNDELFGPAPGATPQAEPPRPTE